MNQTPPLHVQLYEEMIRRIRTGEWRAGDKVPSEKSLTEEFGTSRGPVRQAFAALRAEGMIIGGRGAPPRVQHTAPAQSFDTFMSFTEWARHLGYDPGQRLLHLDTIQATEAQARELQVLPDAPLVQVIRLRLLDERPAMLERSLYPYESGKDLLGADLHNNTIYQTLGAFGWAPVRARHVIDAIAAPALEAEQLQVSLGTPLLRVRRLAYDEHGTVLETADDRYLPSMSSFVVENTAATHRGPFRSQGLGVSPAFSPKPTLVGR
ncbi:GntR family transcriptional regulator [Leucobacter sp. UCMA 4100]|uniref:GntR family transcriptional regulator n=1 Tax=Leucobacter TaxID=55968 RepID=UPI001C22D577|nr:MULTISPECIES: GntR family transcriptional regulator [Leucobacter]MDA3147253.1 GntR family transcriptional regulator [Leucobacter sp. UCMA 4100]